MLYFLWSFLNLGLVIYFFVICFKAVKLVKEKIGLFASVFLVLGFLSFLEQPVKDSYSKESNSNKLKSWTFASEESLNCDAASFVKVDLEKSWISKKQLGIKYGKDMQAQVNIPISAYSTTTGFISGTSWKPISIRVNRTDNDNNFQYFVVGLVDWKLLGTTIYIQSKRFKGIVSTE